MWITLSCTHSSQIYTTFTEGRLTDCIYCTTCCQIAPTSAARAHAGHATRVLTNEEYAHPTRVLTPLNHDATNAQYFFAPESTSTLLSILTGLGLRHIVCVGMPSLHEAIQSRSSPGSSSYLLDVDARFAQFNPPTAFAQYNMFNNHFFNDAEHESFSTFLRTADAIAIDPPFGGLMPAIAQSIQQLWSTGRSKQSGIAPADELPTFLYFPYFLEDKVSSSLPSVRMTDLAVDYANHPTYKVRICMFC